MGFKNGLGSTFASLDFEEDFQFQILVLLIKDSNFVTYYGERFVEPAYFDNDTHSDICRIALDYFRGIGKYKKMPERSTATLLIKKYLEQVPAKLSYLDDYIDILNEIYNYPLEAVDTDFVKDKVREFCKLQACKIAAHKTLEALEQRKFGVIPKLFEDAVMVGEDVQHLPEDHLETFTQRLERYKSGEDTSGRIRTLIKGLDKALEGGPGPGDLATIMGRSNIGKSSLLIQVGAAALWQGKNVLHVSMEMSKLAVQRKYDARLTGIPPKNFKLRSEELKDRMYSHVMSLIDSSLRIMRKPEGRYTVADLKKDLRLLALEYDFYPDVIIMDYLARMANSGRYIPDRVERIANVYQEFRSLLEDEEVIGWNVHQKRRAEGAWKDEDISSGDGDQVADSIDAYVISDIWISAMATSEEYKQKIMRLYVAKARESEKSQLVTVSADLATCNFRDVEITDQEEE